MYVSVLYACMLNVFYNIWISDIVYTRPHVPAYCQATLHISTACRKAFFLLLSFAKLALNVYLITTLQNGDVFNSSLEPILNPSLSLLFLMCQVSSNSISCSNSIAIDKDNVYLTNHRLRRVFFPNIFSISWRIAPAWKRNVVSISTYGTSKSSGATQGHFHGCVSLASCLANVCQSYFVAQIGSNQCHLVDLQFVWSLRTYTEGTQEVPLLLLSLLIADFFLL